MPFAGRIALSQLYECALFIDQQWAVVNGGGRTRTVKKLLYTSILQ